MDLECETRMQSNVIFVFPELFQVDFVVVSEEAI